MYIQYIIIILLRSPNESEYSPVDGCNCPPSTDAMSFTLGDDKAQSLNKNFKK